MPTPTDDLAGHVYGEWTVLRPADPPRRSGCVYWTCVCSCGAVMDVRGKNLTTGRSVQCADCARRKKKSTVYIRWGPYDMHLSDWSRALDISLATLWNRINREWSLRDALSVGVDPVILSLLVPDQSEDPVRVPRGKDSPANTPQPQGKQ